MGQFQSIFDKGNLKTAAEYQKFILKFMRELKYQPKATPVKKDQWGRPIFKIDFVFEGKPYRMIVEEAHLETNEMFISYKGEKHGDVETINDVFDNAKAFKRLLTKACGSLQHTSEANKKFDTLDYKLYEKAKLQTLSAKDALLKINANHPYFNQLLNCKITLKQFIENLEAFRKQPVEERDEYKHQQEIKKLDKALKAIFGNLLRSRQISYHEHEMLTLGLFNTIRF